MPSPYLSQIHVDRPLTNMSVAYIQSDKMFIAGKVFPIVPVDKKSGLYFVYSKDDWFRDDAQLRAPAAESAGGGYDISNTGYVCNVWAFHKDVDEQEIYNADAPISPERDAARFVTRKLLLRQEIQWVTDYMTTGIWTGSSTGTDIVPGVLWDDPLSTPIEDIQAQQLAVLTNTGFEANALVLGFAVYLKLIRHPDIIDLIKYGAGPGNPAIANEAALAKIFGVEKVYISKAVKNTAAKTPGSNTFTGTMVAGKGVLLAYVNSSPGIMEPSSGYTFMWKGISRGLGSTIASYRIPMPWLGLETVRIESEIAFANKVIGGDLAAFFNGAIP
jgi:hypothetical protein